MLVSLLLLGCGHKSIDAEAARKMSDEFMSDLIAHRTDAAFDKMESEFTKNRSDFAPQLEKLFQYCGWPQDSELKDLATGSKVYADGHTNPANTSQFAKGHSYFAISRWTWLPVVKVCG